MDWRAVLAGVGASVAYLLLLAGFPGTETVRLGGVPLVLATGLIAGATAGRLAPSARVGGWHGLCSGSLAGGLFAGSFWYLLALPARPPGVYYGLNYLLAVSAGQFPVVATHGPLVVALLAGVGWAGIAVCGLYAGTRAPQRHGGFIDPGHPR
ncbi:hypothetical protein [Natronomonas sp. EA1]|uniref:hypothetical protein n=1 Tax=Natronomonas sp. EA1 TaxID=3421655 RepID=UPI003EBBA2C1